jgi:Zn-finger nucleic acid-binding protein
VCDNCSRGICGVHERRHELTGASLCRFCNHWVELPIAELLEVVDGHAGRPDPRWSRSLICPDCDISMARGPIGRVMVDCCPRCGGFWFDRTDLSLFMAQFDRYPTWRTLPIHLFPTGVPIDQSVCPRCGTDTLIAGQWNDRAIHQCRKCLGLWLTPAVLDPIMRLMELDRRRQTRQLPRSEEHEALALRAAQAVVEQTQPWYPS